MSTSGKDRKTPDAKDAPSQAGHIVHDSRGNAVWKWDKDNDPSSTASTSKMLRKLDIGSLRVEDAAPTEARTGAGAPNEPKKKGSGYGPGYNPYDRTAPVKRMPPRK